MDPQLVMLAIRGLSGDQDALEAFAVAAPQDMDLSMGSEEAAKKYLDSLTSQQLESWVNADARRVEMARRPPQPISTQPQLSAQQKAFYDAAVRDYRSSLDAAVRDYKSSRMSTHRDLLDRSPEPPGPAMRSDLMDRSPPREGPPVMKPMLDGAAKTYSPEEIRKQAEQDAASQMLLSPEVQALVDKKKAEREAEKSAYLKNSMMISK